MIIYKIIIFMGKLLRVVYHFLSTFGGILSAYALYVEFRRNRDHSYNAFCDIGSYVSCSMVFESRLCTFLILFLSYVSA